MLRTTDKSRRIQGVVAHLDDAAVRVRLGRASRPRYSRPSAASQCGSAAVMPKFTAYITPRWPVQLLGPKRSGSLRGAIQRLTSSCPRTCSRVRSAASTRRRQVTDEPAVAAGSPPVRRACPIDWGCSVAAQLPSPSSPERRPLTMTVVSDAVVHPVDEVSVGWDRCWPVWLQRVPWGRCAERLSSTAGGSSTLPPACHRLAALRRRP